MWSGKKIKLGSMDHMFVLLLNCETNNKSPYTTLTMYIVYNLSYRISRCV